ASAHRRSTGFGAPSSSSSRQPWLPAMGFPAKTPTANRSRPSHRPTSFTADPTTGVLHRRRYGHGSPPPPPVRSPLTSTTSIASSIRARRRVSAVTPITAHPSHHRTADPEASTVPCVRRLFLPKTHLPHFRLAPSDPSIAHQSSGEQQHPRSSMAFDVISFRHHPASVWS
ncbi:hypothetical protein ACLOJK_014727, partial [Asimina triloba]